mgnify:CR=1 FL=1
MQASLEALLVEGHAVHTVAGCRDAGALPWKAHPVFAGVELKHLVTAADTDGALSCHLVRLKPGATLASHVHEGQWELHEVVAGSGTAGLAAQQIAYQPGVAAVIPRGVAHEVTAGEAGLCLFAKFFPALL